MPTFQIISLDIDMTGKSTSTGKGILESLGLQIDFSIVTNFSREEAKGTVFRNEKPFLMEFYSN